MTGLTHFSLRWLTFSPRAVAAVGMLLACTSTLSAQDRLFALLPKVAAQTQDQDQLLEIDTRPGLIGQVRRATPLPTTLQTVFRQGGSVYSIGSGRYLVWLTERGQVVNLFDTITNQLSLFPVLPDGSRLLGVDSGRTRVFVDTFDETFILDGRLGTIRTLRTSPDVVLLPMAAHASAVERLFVAAAIKNSSQIVVNVVDAATGRLERTFPLVGSTLAGMAADADGRRLFVATQQELHVYDTQNGALLTHVPGFLGNGVNYTNALQLDESRRRLLLKINATATPTEEGWETRVAAFDLDTLALLGIVSGSSPLWQLRAQVVTGPRSPMYVFNSLFEGGCRVAQLELYDSDSGAPQQRVDALPLWRPASDISLCEAQLVLQSPPVAPMIQSQIVSGRGVTLSWTPAYDALHYDIEAGSAPGLNDVAVSQGHTSTSFVVDKVPSGHYFVRVRAINWVGRSLPSNEVEIVVP